MKLINKIKAKIFALVFWQTNLGDYVNKIYDIKIFIKYSFKLSKLKSKENYEAYLTKQYHIIEKGLALPEPRFGFGKQKIIELITITNQYLNIYGNTRLIGSIKNTLGEYIILNNKLIDTDNDFYNQIDFFLKDNITESQGGTKNFTLKDIDNATDINFQNFLESRTSVRDFSSESVDNDEIKKAIFLARNTPSVCNRQSWKAHLITDQELKNKLLIIQNGNNGFTNSINKLLIITTDAKKFTKLESNQIFVDGGLFAMNVLLSLHASKIASCCLNTCLPFVTEKEIKKIANISDSERLIMMIGIGKYKDVFKVAFSEKLSVEEILIIH
ncbi:nitroreductase family protein [uncultured Flavobacterium sp.]|uniref:nitroreductase family protein n=1 Tax=uncultured Flavobacterium sp. TaxID=165435 RepID=UPI0030EE5AEA